MHRHRALGKHSSLLFLAVVFALTAVACSPGAGPAGDTETEPSGAPCPEIPASPPMSLYLPQNGSWNLPKDTPTGRLPSCEGVLEIDGLGSFTFDPAEVDQALDIPVEDIRISKNTLFPGLAETELRRVVCFPFAQHYIADSPGCHTPVKDRNQLVSLYNKLGDNGGMRTFSARSLKILLYVSVGVSILAAVLLAILL